MLLEKSRGELKNIVNFDIVVKEWMMEYLPIRGTALVLYAFLYEYEYGEYTQNNDIVIPYVALEKLSSLLDFSFEDVLENLDHLEEIDLLEKKILIIKGEKFFQINLNKNPAEGIFLK